MSTRPQGIIHVSKRIYDDKLALGQLYEIIGFNEIKSREEMSGDYKGKIAVFGTSYLFYPFALESPDDMIPVYEIEPVRKYEQCWYPGCD